MILPTKHLSERRSLLWLGGRVLGVVDEPKTVSRIWDELRSADETEARRDAPTFDWFVLALDLLFALGAIGLTDGRIWKRGHDPSNLQ